MVHGHSAPGQLVWTESAVRSLEWLQQICTAFLSGVAVQARARSAGIPSSSPLVLASVLQQHGGLHRHSDRRRPGNGHALPAAEVASGTARLAVSTHDFGLHILRKSNNSSETTQRFGGGLTGHHARSAFSNPIRL